MNPRSKIEITASSSLIYSPFTKTIRLADTIEVKGADLESGVLKIALENIIPESKKPKKIEINGIKNLASQQLNSLTA